MWLQAPENDYGSLLTVPPPPPRLSVAVCMPVYNRVDLLAKTVAALVPQSYPRDLLEVVIGDDGSSEDVRAAVAPFTDRLRISIHRREHSGYGAGQARNMAAREARSEVLVFIDADCLPDQDLVLRHAEWHHKAENLVVIGSRHGLDTGRFELEELAAGAAPLRSTAFGTDTPDAYAWRQSDHRRLLHRRTADQRHGDEAFRSLVSSNFSIRRDRFLEVDGFDESFRRWGGEDVELGWRCQVAGLFTVAEDSAVCYHQLQEDLWEETGRDESKALNAGVIQNKIPHSFYRKHRVGHIWEVPKVSVIVQPTVDTRLEELAEQVRRQTYTDWEFIVGASRFTDLFAEINAGDPRFRVVSAEDPLDLIASARGEYVAVVHGDAALEPRLLATMVKRLENAGARSVAMCSYRVGDEVYRHPDDLSELDRAWDADGSGLPVFHVARRREWSKAAHAASDAGQAYRQICEWSRPIHVREAYIALRSERPGPHQGEPNPAFVSPTTRLRRDLSASGLSPGALKVVARYVTGRLAPTEERPPRKPAATASSPPVVRYVGWTGHDNLGDEALLKAVTEGLDWADVRTAKRGDLLLLGGGTLINRGSYITWLEDQDSPRIERAVFGTGVANPEFWGDRRQAERWAEWLRTCAYVGVRGPASAETLAGWGLTDVEVVGDPALLLQPQGSRREGLVVVAPCRTRGELWGESDEAVFERLAKLVASLMSRGHEVQVMSSHPDDDGPALEIMRGAGHPDLPYLAGYADLERAMGVLASADLVVAERLHAAVLAAAGGTPFVALEYRPKVRDFARSVGLEEFTLRTDRLDGLEEIVERALTERSRLSTQLEQRVEGYRRKLQAASDKLAEVMGVRAADEP